MKINEINVIEPEDEFIESKFSHIKQGTTTTALLTIRQNKENAIIDNIAHTTKYVDGDFSMILRQNSIKQSTKKVFTRILEEVGKNPKREININFDDYAKVRGVKDKKKLRQQFKNDLMILQLTIISSTEKNAKEETRYFGINLFDKLEYDFHGNATIKLGESFFEILKSNPTMLLPKAYYLTDDRNHPHTASFIETISRFKKMNIDKTNNDILSVETLINNCPTIPSYEEVKNSRRYKERIIIPFDRDLEEVVNMGVIKEYIYYYENGKPLGNTAVTSLKYEDFIRCNIRFTWDEEPQYKERKNKFKKRAKK